MELQAVGSLLLIMVIMTQAADMDDVDTRIRTRGTVTYKKHLIM